MQVFLKNDIKVHEQTLKDVYNILQSEKKAYVHYDPFCYANV